MNVPVQRVGMAKTVLIQTPVMRSHVRMMALVPWMKAQERSPTHVHASLILGEFARSLLENMVKSIYDSFQCNFRVGINCSYNQGDINPLM